MDINEILNDFFSGPWVPYFWVTVALVLIIVFHDYIKFVLDFILQGIKFIVGGIIKIFKKIFGKKKKK